MLQVEDVHEWLPEGVMVARQTVKIGEDEDNGSGSKEPMMISVALVTKKSVQWACEHGWAHSSELWQAPRHLQCEPPHRTY